MILGLRKLRPKYNDSGFMAAEWVICIGFLLVPTFVLVFSLVQVPSRQTAIQSASAAAARAYVQALDQGQAETAARAAAAASIAAEKGDPPPSSDESVTNYLTSNGVTMVFTFKNNGYCPGQEIAVRVSAPMPLVLNPFNSSGSTSAATLRSTSTERIDDYAELAGSPSGLDYHIENGTCPE